MLYPLTWWLLTFAVNAFILVTLLSSMFFFGCAVAAGINKLIEESKPSE